MVNAQETVVFDICDGKVYEMYADTAGASAGPSYGEAIDLPGIGALSGFDPQIVSAELKGDCRVIARQGRIDSVNASITYGKIAIPVLTALHDMQAFSSGLIEGARIKGGAEIKYFKFTGTITGTDAGVDDVQVIFYKAQLTSETLFDQASDQFGQPKFDMSAIGIDSGAAEGVGPYPGLEVATLADILITSEA